MSVPIMHSVHNTQATVVPAHCANEASAQIKIFCLILSNLCSGELAEEQFGQMKTPIFEMCICLLDLRHIENQKKSKKGKSQKQIQTQVFIHGATKIWLCYSKH